MIKVPRNKVQTFLASDYERFLYMLRNNKALLEIYYATILELVLYCIGNDMALEPSFLLYHKPRLIFLGGLLDWPVVYGEAMLAKAAELGIE